MAKKGHIEDPSILEAVDNLSSMAELNLDELTEDQKDLSAAVVISPNRWLDLKDEKKTYESVKSTFKVVHNYLKHVYQKESKHLKDKGMQRGIESIMTLANEAAGKIDAYSKFFKGSQAITNSREYQDLLEFYKNKIQTRFQNVLDAEDEWNEEWGEESDAADIQRRGLKDLETVTRDRDYELFYITKEDGTRFYNRNLIRHIRMVADFDQIIGDVVGDDPLLKVQVIQDKEAYQRALTIRKGIDKQLNSWIIHAGKHREDTFVQNVFKAILALLLASNLKNTLSFSAKKNSLAYFKDFQTYLRLTLGSVDYQSLIENPGEEPDAFFEATLSMLHKLCYLLFSVNLQRDEARAFFIRTINYERNENEKSKRSSLALWNHLLDDHEKIARELKHFPSGPLFKTLDIVLDRSGANEFDPYMNGDLPLKLYDAQIGSKLEVYKFPCPTRQSTIQKAEMIPEFYGMLRQLVEKKQKLLIINFQDRTSWKEFARSAEFEKTQRNAEFRNFLDIVTLPKNTDFYLQSEDYLKLSNACEFKDLLLEQILSAEECGFYFPRYLNKEDINEFSQKAIEMIHEVFFSGKQTLSRKNRLDFIEIFYHLLIMKMVQLSGALHLAFSAKDGCDTSAIASASFFAFIKLLEGEIEWKYEDAEFMEEMIFISALLTRERPVDATALSRIIGMLSIVTAEVELSKNTVQSKLQSLFGIDFQKELNVHKEFN